MAYSSIDRSSAVSRYLSEIREFSILSEEEERELSTALRSKDKAKAIHGLVESNLAFVVKIVAEYRSPALPFEDLLNEGNIGLIEAARRFDHTRGARFLTYAVWWIRKSVLRALAENPNLVRIPLTRLKKIRRVRATEQALVRKLGRMPEREEISQELHSTLAKIDDVLQTRQKALSLDDPVDWRKRTPVSDHVVDHGSANPEEELLREERQELISVALKDLSDQERTVIAGRFGLAGGEPLTLREVGKQLGLTGERVRQIERQAMKHLRRAISRYRAISPPPTVLPSPRKAVQRQGEF